MNKWMSRFMMIALAVSLLGLPVKAGAAAETGKGNEGKGKIVSGYCSDGGRLAGDTRGYLNCRNGRDTGAPVPLVKLADPLATFETRSLFQYLKSVQGSQIIFGQQAATSEGVTITVKDGTQSDTLNAVGDLPGVFGFDVQSLGNASYTASRDKMLALMKAAYRDGGILTVSGHLPNFATGGTYSDTTGGPVQRIMPGGDKNGEYTVFLDRVAEMAGLLTDDSGKPIPVIFRPYHEHNGSWFWWGSAYRSKEQYVELYRYTVEYLRDRKGVHNFLYAYSPNSPFGSSVETYLAGYPGDDYVDILGFDSYSSGSPGWYDFAVQDAALAASLAQDKDKVAAFTEFGYQYGTAQTKDAEFYTKLLSKLKADPGAGRIAYMMTWVNWSAESAYVPYRDGPGGIGDHPLLTDFTAFYSDAYTSFRNEVIAGQPYSRETEASAHSPFLHVANPTANQDIPLTDATVIRARVLNETVERVVYTVGNSGVEHALAPDADGFYYTGSWTPDASMNESEVMLTVKAYAGSSPVLEESFMVYVSEGVTTDPLVVDAFEGYRGKNDLLKNAYGTSGDANAITLDTDHKSGGQYGLRYDYRVATGYTGRTKDMKLADWSPANKLQFWMEPDGSNQKLVIQISAGGIAFEAYPSLAGTAPGLVEIPFSEFKPAAWNTANAGKIMTQKNMKGVKSFSIFVNRNPDSPGTSGTLYFDDIKAVYDPSIAALPYDQAKIFGFEDGMLQGFEINSNDSTLAAGGLSVSDAVYRSGGHSLTTGFSLVHSTDPAKSGVLQIRRKSTASSGTADLTGYKQIVGRFKIVLNEGAQVNGPVSALLYTQSGPSWGTYTFRRIDNIQLAEQNGFVEIALPIGEIPDLAQVQVFGLKIFVPAGSTGNAVIYLDDFEIQ